MDLQILKSRRTVISIVVDSVRYKVMQLMFNKRDGSIFINFPYYTDSRGLVSLVKFPGGINLPTDLSLIDGGKVTSHLVKYSHHPDGRAHFSQDSKVKTEIIKKSVPLNQINGHFFTAKFQGIHHFKTEKLSKKTIKKERQIIDFNFEDENPNSIKVVGRMYSKTELIGKIEGNARGPIMHTLTDSGERSLGILIGDPVLRQREKVIVVTCEKIPIFDKESESAVSFIGGFDERSITLNTSLDTSFLALSYPASNYEQLRKEIGSIDYRAAT